MSAIDLNEIANLVLAKQIDLEMNRAAEYVAWRLREHFRRDAEKAKARGGEDRNAVSVSVGSLRSNSDGRPEDCSIEIAVKVFNAKTTIHLDGDHPVSHTPFLDAKADEAAQEIEDQRGGMFSRR